VQLVMLMALNAYCNWKWFCRWRDRMR